MDAIGWKEQWRRLTAEGVGTAALLAAIVGSGIVTGQDGAASAQLFQHAITVGLALAALILALGPVSGAHFNPAVTIVDAWFQGLPWPRAIAYIAAQLTGAVAGTVFTNATFGRAAIEVATTARDGGGLVAAEAAATAGLIVVIFGMIRSGGGRAVGGAVGAYVAAALVVRWLFAPAPSEAAEVVVPHGDPPPATEDRDTQTEVPTADELEGH